MSSQQQTNQWIVRDKDSGNEWKKDSRSEAEQAIEEFGDEMELEIVPPNTINSKASESVEEEPGEEDGETQADIVEPSENGTEQRETTTEVQTETSEALDKLGESIEHDPLNVLPSYMITRVDNEPTLNKRGVSVLAYHYGVSVEESEILDKPSETDFEHAAVRVRVSIEDGREFVGMGEAHVDEMDKTRLLRMAETRAYKRAVIFATGTGIIGYQEVTNQL